MIWLALVILSATVMVQTVRLFRAKRRCDELHDEIEALRGEIDILRAKGGSDERA